MHNTKQPVKGDSKRTEGFSMNLPLAKKHSDSCTENVLLKSWYKIKTFLKPVKQIRQAPRQTDVQPEANSSLTRQSRKIVTTEKCFVCGCISAFSMHESATLIREAACENCGASLRNSDVARIFVESALGKTLSIHEAKAELQHLYICNASHTGALHNALKELPYYFFGEYIGGIASGKVSDGIVCVDLQDIPYKDNMFDMIITEGVLEHVEYWEKAMAEISRVLKPSGHHVFSVPVHEGKKTVSRKTNPKKIYHYGVLGQGNVIVFTDFGDDLPALLNQFGFETHATMCHRFHDIADITDCDAEYQTYLLKKDSLLDFFRYNNIIFDSVNRKD